MSILRIGIVGCGRVTEKHHLPALKRIRNAVPVALADTDASRLDQLAGRFGIARRFPDYRSLVECADVDVVAVCVPPHLHAKVALAALAADKHVFIEKPLAVSLEECDTLVERATHSNRIVTVGFNMRWHRLVRRARDAITQQCIGRPVLMRSSFTSCLQARGDPPAWRRRRETGGGTLFENAVHHIDLWRFLLGSEVDEVYVNSRAGERDDETVVLTATLRNGIRTCAVFSDTTSPGQEFSVFGQAGSLHISCYRFDGFEMRGTTDATGDLANRMKQVRAFWKDLPQGLHALRRGGDWNGSHETEWIHFLDAIRGKAPLEITLEDGRRAVEVVLAAIESAQRGEPVPIRNVRQPVLSSQESFEPTMTETT